MDIWMAAITYVMLSRICSLSQLYILDEFDESKMYPSQVALEELERLEQMSINSNPSDWGKEETGTIKIYSLKCRSLRKHYPDIISDILLLKRDIICLQETWLEDDVIVNDLEIEHYALHLNSNGRGKGLAIYYKKNIFKHETDVKEENMQISKFTSSDIDVLVLYRSQNGNLNLLRQHLEELMNSEKPTMVIGDFNFCFLEDSSQSLKNYLTENFSQLVKEPTHIEGNLLDQHI
jgi:exonuclease III